jgi:D-threo-aldose 1-dehydrogenase
MFLSSKVGKLLKASPHNNAKSNFLFSPSPNNVLFDYTADGVRRSIEDSLQRMGVSRLDLAFVHDVSSDNKLLPTDAVGVAASQKEDRYECQAL